MVQVRKSREADLPAMLAIINDAAQKTGIGTRLLKHVEGLARKPVLVGTWAAASWAIEFYRQNGFSVVPEDEKNRLLRK